MRYYITKTGAKLLLIAQYSSTIADKFLPYRATDIRVNSYLPLNPSSSSLFLLISQKAKCVFLPNREEKTIKAK